MTTGAAALGTLALKGFASSSTTAQTQPASAPINSNDSKALYEAVKKEGKLVWYAIWFNQDIVNEISAAFSAKYPGIKAEGTRNTAQVIFQKLNQEMQAGIKNVDVFGTTDISQMMELKDQGKLMQYVPAGKENQYALAGFDALTAAGCFHHAALPGWHRLDTAGCTKFRLDQ